MHEHREHAIAAHHTVKPTSQTRAGKADRTGPPLRAVHDIFPARWLVDTPKMAQQTPLYTAASGT